MLRKLRKSSSRVTLVLVGVAALAGCGRADDQRRDVYASREDCLADWGNKPQDCTPATDDRHRGGGYFWGPLYAYHAFGGNRGWTSAARSGSRAIGSTSSHVSRGGFGASGHAAGG